MSFWYYAFWYLFIGVVLDVGLSTRTKPSLWSIFLWPIIIVVSFGIIIRVMWNSGDEPRRYE